MAYPAHQPTPETRKQVEIMSGRYIPHDDIAAIIGVSDETLRRHYREELDRGKALGNLDIADRLHKKAKEGNVAALIFLAKIRLKWSEKQTVEVTGKDGGPVQHEHYLAQPPEERLAALNALANRVLGPSAAATAAADGFETDQQEQK